jgi:hypothetical protein
VNIVGDENASQRSGDGQDLRISQLLRQRACGVLEIDLRFAAQNSGYDVVV